MYIKFVFHSILSKTTSFQEFYLRGTWVSSRNFRESCENSSSSTLYYINWTQHIHHCLMLCFPISIPYQSIPIWKTTPLVRVQHCKLVEFLVTRTSLVISESNQYHLPNHTLVSSRQIGVLCAYCYHFAPSDYFTFQKLPIRAFFWTFKTSFRVHEKSWNLVPAMLHVLCQNVSSHFDQLGCVPSLHNRNVPAEILPEAALGDKCPWINEVPTLSALRIHGAIENEQERIVVK